jgi:hypothetical protein
VTVKRRKPNASGPTPSAAQRKLEQAERLHALSARVLESVDPANATDALAKMRDALALQDAFTDTLGLVIARQDRASGANRSNAAKRARYPEIQARHAELCRAGKARNAASIVAREFKITPSQVRRIIAARK